MLEQTNLAGLLTPAYNLATYQQRFDSSFTCWRQEGDPSGIPLLLRIF